MVMPSCKGLESIGAQAPTVERMRRAAKRGREPCGAESRAATPSHGSGEAHLRAELILSYNARTRKGGK